MLKGLLRQEVRNLSGMRSSEENTDMSPAKRYIELQEFAIDMAKRGKIPYLRVMGDMIGLFKIAFPRGI